MGEDGEVGHAVLTIVPEPSGTERDAIVAALTVLALRRRVAEPAGSSDPVSRWRVVARREAVRVGRGDAGWRRGTPQAGG